MNVCSKLKLLVSFGLRREVVGNTFTTAFRAKKVLI